MLSTISVFNVETTKKLIKLKSVTLKPIIVLLWNTVVLVVNKKCAEICNEKYTKLSF